MIGHALRYAAGASSERDIRVHLMACDPHFVPPLRERVNIDEYARKLAERALTIEAWHGNVLVGLIGAYVAATGESCFVSNVSVLPEFTGRGIATKLLRNLETHPACANATAILLEVSKRNVEAVQLYAGFGFQITEERDEQVLMRYARTLDNAKDRQRP